MITGARDITRQFFKLSFIAGFVMAVCIKFQKSNVGGLGYRPMTLGILAQTCCQLLVTVK